MSNLKLIFPTAIVLGGFLVCTTASYGTQEYAKTTKQKCAYCHEKVVAEKETMKSNLTPAGKYFAEHKSLDGYVEKK